MKENLKEGLGKCLGCVIGIPIVFGLIYFGMQCEKKHEDEFPWKGAFYNSTEESSISDSKDFKTVDECRSWANNLASDRNLKAGEWKFSCGTGCKYSDQSIVSGKRVNTYNCEELITQ